MGLKQVGQLGRSHLRPWKPARHRHRPAASHWPSSEPRRSQLQAAEGTFLRLELSLTGSVLQENLDSVLTFAGAGGRVAVEPGQAALTEPTGRVVQTLQAFSAVAVAASRRADVDVTVAAAGSAGSLRASQTCGVAIETLTTGVAVKP